jgi:hypothetical protein
MDNLEKLGAILFVSALVLGGISLFVPRKKLLKIKLEAIPPGGIGGHFTTLKPIHAIPFWTLNPFGKILRISIDSSAIVGLVLLNISYWIK